MPTEEFRGNFVAFLKHLLAKESGVDPDRHDWYIENMDRPTYFVPAVSSPGRIIRDLDTGLPIKALLTVREYFKSIGVNEWFQSDNRLSLYRMQYLSMNALGFIGYQFGEAALYTLGVYEPQQVSIKGLQGMYPRIYCGDITHNIWNNRRTEYVYRNPWSGLVTMATDVNTWTGKFTGLCGVWTLDDLRTKECQEALIILLLKRNSQEILKSLNSMEHIYEPETVCSSFFANEIQDIFNRRSSAPYYSGLLAAAHLCGPNSVISFLNTGQNAVDEFSISVKNYIEDFKGYDLRPLLNT